MPGRVLTPLLYKNIAKRIFIHLPLFGCNITKKPNHSKVENFYIFIFLYFYIYLKTELTPSALAGKYRGIM
jgi:hypothetical protein